MLNIKDRMASKYPEYNVEEKPLFQNTMKESMKHKNMKEGLTSKSSNEYSSDKLYSSNTKLLIMSLFLAILFMILSFPKLYKYTGGKFINTNINYDNFTNLFTLKMPILHSIIFFFISFAVLKFSM
jgi:hypothetical protein